MEDYKIKVQQAINERQLSSIMNNTKWRGLQSAVKEEFPITPSFQVKFLLDDFSIPEDFGEENWYSGDWEEGLEPFFAVEWIRVNLKYTSSKGLLLEPEVTDYTDEFIKLLKRLKIPFLKEDNTIRIYGYVRSTDIFS
ncbi:DUF6678 family protein [Neobacillus niacini]|uniref:DUF6678 family protein n=1 Tax=Neobacillus niacini TaxID=86668 RepID=UPI00285ADF77|nr:DUF6678 family protein [Neobacillus niacini]MDR7003005.1 hypothetical protein [Neobacillus niacini]